MKTIKYLAIALAAVLILLVTGWLLRDTLIERLTNPVFAEYGLAITDVSLDALATRNASISYLELEYVNGTVVAINELTLPIRRSASGFRRFTAAKIAIDLRSGGEERIVDLAGALIQLLELPLQLPQTEMQVAELSAPPYPVMRDLLWRFTGDEQQLTAGIETLSLKANITGTSDTYYLLNLSFADSAAATADQSITADVQRTDAGFSLHGSGTLDLRSWNPVIALLGIDAVSVESGSATLRFDSEIAFDSNQIPFVHAGLTPTTPVRLRLPNLSDAITSVTVDTASTTEVSAALTDLRWSLRQPKASITVSDTDGNDFAVSLSNMTCESGLHCAGNIGIASEDLDLPLTDVARFELKSAQRIDISGDGARVHVSPDATIALIGIASPGLALARLDAKLTSAGEFELRDADWRFSAQSVDVRIEDYAVADNVTFSAPVFLDDVSLGRTNRQTFAQAGLYASSSNVNWNTRRIRLPGFKGNVTLRGADLAVLLETDGLDGEAGIEAQHNVDTERGQLSVDGARVSFDAQPLSNRFTPRPRAWDIIAGTLGIDLMAAWEKPEAEWQVRAQTSMQATKLAGNWNDTVIVGLTTGVEAEYDHATGFTVQPSTLELAFLDIGLPLENISAGYTLHPGKPSVDVENLRMSAFGGLITADPFSFSTARQRNNLILHAEAIDLAEILSIEEFEAIQITGRIGAELPVTIEGQTVTVSGGKLTGQAPGGVIRYRPGTGSGQPEASSIGFATRALSNFRYETLTSDVEYESDGDLKLQMRLTGRNPDLESSRPVILNLGVENNIPQMLRSLQAARAVEELLERRLSQ